MSQVKKPVILVAEEDEQVRQSVVDSLEKHNQDRYTVHQAKNYSEARETLVRCRVDQEDVALLVVDCSLSGRPGMDLVEQAGELFPQARRMLLADYTERENVLQALNQYELDSYLIKPLNHPDDELFPLVDDLLADWRTTGRPSANGIRIVGFRWSPPAHQIRNFLARNLVPYRWLEIGSVPEAQQLLDEAGLNHHCLPVAFFPDGGHLQQPSIDELAEKVGLHQEAEAQFYDLVVVGGGPAGLSAAVYGASEGLRTLLIEAEAPGGQARQSSRIENYLGFPAGLSGMELTRRAVAQAQRFGVEILTPQQATGVRLEGPYRLITLADGSEVAAHTLLVATGVSYRHLEAPGADRLTGAGVYYGAVITEALTCQDREVFILGGGNSAGQAAMYLTRFARHITILTNMESLEATMSQYLTEQINATENIDVRVRSTVEEVFGEDHLESLTLLDEASGQREKVPAAALFIYIGASPRTDWLGDLLARDEQGYLLTGQDVVQARSHGRFRKMGREPFFLESSVPGIFVAGDTRSGSVKRIASSVGEGAMAVTFIHQYLAAL